MIRGVKGVEGPSTPVEILGLDIRTDTGVAQLKTINRHLQKRSSQGSKDKLIEDTRRPTLDRLQSELRQNVKEPYSCKLTFRVL